QGISAQGISAQGISAQGISAQGISAQGISAQGISAQCIGPPGITAQGISAQAAPSVCIALVADATKDGDVGANEVRGTPSDSGGEPVELPGHPGRRTGKGALVDAGVAPPRRVGRWVAAPQGALKAGPAEVLDRFIAGERPDPVPNLLHRSELKTNDDVML